jgi:hypothetical protein
MGVPDAVNFKLFKLDPCPLMGVPDAVNFKPFKLDPCP